MQYSRAGMALAIAFCGTMTGCANLNAVHHVTGLDDNFFHKNKMVAMDAKQRVVISSSADNGMLRYCAEPSPDAFSVFSASLDASANYKDNVSAGLKQAMAESGTSLTVRTQSIQLMRDAMYRLCEARMNGALSDADYVDMQSRYQKSMTVLMAIESLAGAVFPPPAILNSQAAQGGADIPALVNALKTVQDQKSDKKAALEKTEAALKTASDGKADADKACKADPKSEDCGKKAGFQASVDKETANRDSLKADIAKLDAAEKATSDAIAAGGSGHSATAGGSSTMTVSYQPPSKETVMVLASTVQQMVDHVFQVDADKMCVDVIRKKAATDSARNEISKITLQDLKESTKPERKWSGLKSNAIQIMSQTFPVEYMQSDDGGLDAAQKQARLDEVKKKSLEKVESDFKPYESLYKACSAIVLPQG